MRSVAVCRVALVACVLLCVYVCGSLGAVSYLKESKFSSSYYVSPPTFNGHLTGPIGFPLNQTSPWYLAQWDITHPISLGPVVRGSGPCYLKNADWYTANPSSRICYQSSTNSLELSQAADDLKCAIEYDLFVSPTTGPYTGVPYNWNTNVGTLSQLRNVYFNFTVQIPYRQITPRCGTTPCGNGANLDYAYSTAAVVLSSPTHNQGLFYQIILSDSRAGLGCDENPCKAQTSWFFTTNPFGINDAIGVFGYPCLSPAAGTVRVEMNILPRLLNALSLGTKYGLINDPSSWSIGSFYIGGGGNGNFVQNFIVSDVSLGANY